MKRETMLLIAETPKPPRVVEPEEVVEVVMLAVVQHVPGLLGRTSSLQAIRQTILMHL